MGILDKIKSGALNVFSKKGTNKNNNSSGNYCPKCGESLQEGASFCSKCGSGVDGNVVMREGDKTRHTEYLGEVLKCPNCGAVITETTAICPECNVKITRLSAVGSVQKFKEEIFEIEKGRSKGLKGLLNMSNSTTDSQILMLIKTFPIPNSVDDILEFIFLSIANIDVSLSKKSMFKKNGIKAEISNAWVLKMQQAYEKAKIAFSSEPSFKQIQNIYYGKMKELKLKVID